MIAIRIPITDLQVATYKDANLGEIDTSAKELVLHCDVDGVTIVNTRTGTIINKLRGTPVANKRDVRYDFVAAEWEFVTPISTDILTLLSELEGLHPTGIPVKNYLEPTNTGYTAMDIKFLAIERRGASISHNGSFRPFNGVNLRIARVDIP